MKNSDYIFYLYLCMAAVCLGCYDDKGNYDYLGPEEVMPVKIDGLNIGYSLGMLSSLHLEPEVTGMDAEENYKFTWYYSSLSSNIKHRDTLALTRNLDVEFDCVPGKYTLIYEVRDKRTDLYVNKKIELEFVSDFDHGWYVLKDENGLTDFDFISPDSNVRNDAYSKIHGHKMPGEAVRIVYQSNRYRQEIVQPDGTVKYEQKPAIHVVSRNDFNVLNASDFTLYKAYNDFFLEVPQERAPQNFSAISNRGHLALINGGKLHLLYGIGSNTGRVNVALVGDYQLAGDMVVNQSRGVMVFDRSSRSFLYSGSFMSTQLQKFKEKELTPGTFALSPSDMEADLVALLHRDWSDLSGSTKAYALMQNGNEYYLADIRFDGGYPFVSFDTLSGSYQVAKAKVFATHQVASCIYFAAGSTLYAHTVSRDNTLPADVKEKTLRDFPGETIAYVAHVKSANAKDAFDNLVVLTNREGGGWKLYRFALKGNTFEIDPVPVAVYEGQGTARYAMFRV